MKTIYNPALRWTAISTALIPFLQLPLCALPTGSEVTAGQASMQEIHPGVLNVETGDKAIINWQSFSIDASESMRFVQSSASSMVLNRVVGKEVSSIFGKLDANGKVFLINPQGVLIGKDAVINTSAFIASTLDIPDAVFWKGDDFEFAGDSVQAVINHGTIRAKDGDIMLIGVQVENDGALETHHGTAYLVAASDVLIKPLDENRVYIRVKQPGDGSEAIQALKTDLEEGNPYRHAIRHSGSISSFGIEEIDGRVYLVAEEGRAEISGTITSRSNSNGGSVAINADGIDVLSEAMIDVNADVKGQGGKVNIIGRGYTNYYGTVAAEGGSQEGDGGFVEISGGKLSFQGKVSTQAPFGQTGKLLLDPNDITVSVAATNPPYFNHSYFNGAGIAMSNLNVTDLVSALNTNNVEILTASFTAGGNGDITFVDSVSWSSPFSLTVNSARNLKVLNVVTNAGSGSINLIAGHDLNIGDPTGSGTIPVQVGSKGGSTYLSASGNLNVTGGSALNASAQVGFNDATSVSGNISIYAIKQNLTVLGGTGSGAFAAIGHGSPTLSGGTVRSNVVITNVGGTLTVQGGLNSGAYAQIGHLHTGTSSVQTTGDVIASNINGVINIMGGSGANAYAFIGHGGLSSASGDLYSGRVHVETLGSQVNVTGGSAVNTMAGIGHTDGLGSSPGNITVSSKEIALVSGQDMNIQAGTANGAHALIGAFFNATTTPNQIRVDQLQLYSGNGLTLQGSNAISSASTLIGSKVPLGNASCNLYIFTQNALSVNANASLVQIIDGSGSPMTLPTSSIYVSQGMTMNGGSFSDASIDSIGSLSVYVGTGDLDLNASSSGQARIKSAHKTNIYSGGDVNLTGNIGGKAAFIETQNMALSLPADPNDALTITANNILLQPNSYIINDGLNNGDLTLITNVDLTVNGDVNANSYIYNSGTGNLNLSSQRNMNIHASITSPGQGTMNIFAGGNLNVGQATNAVRSQLGLTVGTININVKQNINVIAGNTTNAFAQIGAQGNEINANINLNFVGGDILVQADTALNTFGLIGHRSPNTMMGTVNIGYEGGTTTTVPGMTSDTFAQVGNYTGSIIP